MAGQAVVIGSGMGGLSAALILAHQGLSVTILEAQAQAGGKLRQVAPGGAPIDCGPTVFTMDWAFRSVFEAAGETLDDHLRLTRADVLARHAWPDGGRLDLYADVDRSAEAIAELAGPREAAAFRRFCARAQRVFDGLSPTFMQRQRPSFADMARRVGPDIRLAMDMAPHMTMAHLLRSMFKDPRLRQLFGRYATYVGGSPYLTPALLILIWHAERAGVWAVDGGMYEIVRRLSDLIESRGGVFVFQQAAAELLITSGRVAGVRTSAGETYPADVVVYNGDVAALAAGALGQAAKTAVDAAPPTPRERSLSAITLAAQARTEGFPLAHHTIFFSDDYEREFDDILTDRRPPAWPSVYICAQDRAGGTAPTDATERLFAIINAPADGDAPNLSADAARACVERALERIADMGLRVHLSDGATVIQRPADFAARFPQTGGAIYGRAPHGAFTPLQRPGARAPIRGLYFAGGSVHPGPGVPMAALSGRLAAEAALADRRAAA